MQGNGGVVQPIISALRLRCESGYIYRYNDGGRFAGRVKEIFPAAYRCIASVLGGSCALSLRRVLSAVGTLDVDKIGICRAFFLPLIAYGCAAGIGYAYKRDGQVIYKIIRAFRVLRNFKAW